jgi:hypothetical protein
VLSRGAPRGAIVWETLRTSPSAYQVTLPACISLGHVSCRVEAAPVQGAGQYVAV